MLRRKPTPAEALAIAALVALWLLTSINETSDPDVFWHLAIGRAALERRSTLPVEIFSYSFAGKPWAYKDLVSGVLFYLGFRCFGFGSFVVWKGIAVAAFASAFHRLQPPATRNLGLTVAATALTLASFWLIERPNLVSLFLFALLLPLLEAKERHWRVLIFLWIWALLHRFALIGVALAVPALLVQKRWREAAAAPVVVLFTPNLLAIYTTSVHAVLDRGGLAQTTEWSRLAPGTLFSFFPVACLAVMAGVVSIRRDTGIVALPLVLFGALSLAAVRWVPYAAIAAVAVLVKRVRLPERPRGIAALATVVLAAFLVYRHQDEPWAIGEDRAWSPRGAVEFARAHQLRGRVVDSMDLGGYLLFAAWPDIEVMIDSRNEIVYPSSFVSACAKAERGDAALFAKMRSEDGVDWVLAANEPGQHGYGYLARDPSWSMVYWSDTATVFTRRDAHAELEPLRYEYIDPRDVAASVAQAIESGVPPMKLRAEISRLSAKTAEGQQARLLYVEAFGAGHR